MFAFRRGPQTRRRRRRGRKRRWWWLCVQSVALQHFVASAVARLFTGLTSKKKKILTIAEKMKERRKRGGAVCSLVVVLTRFRSFSPLHHLLLVSLLFFSSFADFWLMFQPPPKTQALVAFSLCLVLCHWAVCRLLLLCLLPLLVLFAHYR